MALTPCNPPFEARMSRAIERAIEVFNASQEAHKMAARAAGQDAGVAMLALMSWVLWVLGDVDEAVTRLDAALERAKARFDPGRHDLCRFRYSSTLAKSLSPRPDMFTTIR